MKHKEKTPRIDPHLHCRDGKESHKTNIREVSEIAQNQGISAILDMPPLPIFTEEDVKARLALAGKRKPVVKYFLYVALTSTQEQIREAVRVFNKYPQVVGLKLRTSETAGFPGVSRETEQRMIYQILTEEQYKGVLAVHCEDESRFKPELWNPKKPCTHSLARPAEAEIEAVGKQIQLAEKSGFSGILHICHISCQEAVQLVELARKQIKITCGATPHHILMSYEDIIMQDWAGLFFKVNPPLRSFERKERLLQCLLEGKIDWIETDYAPHTREEKIGPPYLSGIANFLPVYNGILDWLQLKGFSPELIESLTYWNIKRAFGKKLEEV